MPLFNRGKKDKTNSSVTEEAPLPANGQAGGRDAEVENESRQPRPKLVFHCQQAHGSPTGVISGFTNVKELYQRIASCYEIQASDVRMLSQFSESLSHVGAGGGRGSVSFHGSRLYWCTDKQFGQSSIVSY